MEEQKPLITGEQTLQEISTPSNPASGYLKIYPKTDNKLYKLTSAGTETEIGGGGSGSQTPWTSDINGAGYNLNSVGRGQFGFATINDIATAVLVTADDPLDAGTDGIRTQYGGTDYVDPSASWPLSYAGSNVWLLYGPNGIIWRKVGSTDPIGTYTGWGVGSPHGNAEVTDAGNFPMLDFGSIGGAIEHLNRVNSLGGPVYFGGTLNTIGTIKSNSDLIANRLFIAGASDDGYSSIISNGNIQINSAINQSYYGQVNITNALQSAFSFRNASGAYIFGHDVANSGTHDFFIYDVPTVGDQLVPFYIVGNQVGIGNGIMGSLDGSNQLQVLGGARVAGEMNVRTMSFESIIENDPSQNSWNPVIDWSLGELQFFNTGNGTPFNLNFTSPSKPCHRQLITTETAVGSLINWAPISIKWIGQPEYQPQLGNNKVTILSLIWDGTYWYGTYATQTN